MQWQWQCAVCRCVGRAAKANLTLQRCGRGAWASRYCCSLLAARCWLAAGWLAGWLLAVGCGLPSAVCRLFLRAQLAAPGPAARTAPPRYPSTRALFWPTRSFTRAGSPYRGYAACCWLRAACCVCWLLAARCSLLAVTCGRAFGTWLQAAGCINTANRYANTCIAAHYWLQHDSLDALQGTYRRVAPSPVSRLRKTRRPPTSAGPSERRPVTRPRHHHQVCRLHVPPSMNEPRHDRRRASSWGACRGPLSARDADAVANAAACSCTVYPILIMSMLLYRCCICC